MRSCGRPHQLSKGPVEVFDDMASSCTKLMPRDWRPRDGLRQPRTHCRDRLRPPLSSHWAFEESGHSLPHHMRNLTRISLAPAYRASSSNSPGLYSGNNKSRRSADEYRCWLNPLPYNRTKTKQFRCAGWDRAQSHSYWRRKTTEVLYC